MQVVHVDTYNCSRTAAVAIPSFNVEGNLDLCAAVGPKIASAVGHIAALVVVNSEGEVVPINE